MRLGVLTSAISDHTGECVPLECTNWEIHSDQSAGRNRVGISDDDLVYLVSMILVD
jgi:hypothetical protein